MHAAHKEHRWYNYLQLTEDGGGGGGSATPYEHIGSSTKNPGRQSKDYHV